MDPEVFGRYRLLESIGRGGMAEVFLARQEGIAGVGRRLALKRIHPQFTTDDNFVKMFIDEARIVGHFNHPNIVQMVDFGKVHEIYYIAMEFVDGLSIAGVMGHNLKSHSRIDIEAIIEMGIQIGLGMDYAHKEKDQDGEPLGIIHRDLTPHNILVSREGSVKITDFGIAKASMNTHMTQAGMIKGKVPYMSPEQAMGQPLDQRSDIFSIGIILYEMCTLTRLFHGPSDFHVLQKVIAAEIPSIREQNPDVPEELERVILKLLTAEREDRYADAGEMVSDLRRLKFSMGETFFDFKLGGYISGILEAQKPQEPAPGAEPSSKASPEGAAGSGAEGASAFAGIGGNTEGGFDVGNNEAMEDVHTVLMAAHNEDAPPPVGAEEATRLIQTGETDRDESIQSAIADMSAQPENLADDKAAPGANDALQTLAGGKGSEAPQAASPQPAPSAGTSSGMKLVLVGLVAVALAVLGFLIFGGKSKGDLSVQVSPDGASIIINGTVVSQSSTYRWKEAVVGQPITIRLEKDGYVPLEETVTLEGGQPLILDRALKLDVPPEGFLMLQTEPPGADVIVAGQPTGWKTPKRVTLSSGETHTMTLQLEGYAPVERSFKVKAGKETTKTITLEPLNPTPAAE